VLNIGVLNIGVLNIGVLNTGVLNARPAEPRGLLPPRRGEYDSAGSRQGLYQL
jgi:hypothetical protein